MKIFKFLIIFIFSVNVFAAEMKIEAAHIKANQPGQNITAGFIKILSDSTLKITQISSKDAKKIEIHSMRMEKGPYGDTIMKMRKIDKTIKFKLAIS
jgi:copper(I)-binding protein